MGSFSKGSLLLALVVLTECLSEHHLSLFDKEQKDRQQSQVDLAPKEYIKTVSTLKWQYTDEPNTLVFDFEELDVSQHDVVQLIKSNLPPNTRYCISKYANSRYLVSVSLDGLQESTEEHPQLAIRHKQLFSILKYRGLYIKQRNVFLYPTIGLCSSNVAVNFWCFEILDLSKSAFDCNPTELKTHVAREVAYTFGKSSVESMILIDSNNIKLSSKKNGSIVLLAQEVLLTQNSPSCLQSPIKKLVFIPFLKSYFPLIATKITPFRKVYDDRIIEHQ
ncbi:hypothetical protein BD560DRAFT_446435 [Blakeslea trispora]|nr:hypothetical protein BD560DRAFT_446435 [Blakeslea trispora]